MDSLFIISCKSYKYQGQELQETGFYSFKWRNYDPSIGRFLSIDPLSERFPYNSTYAFQENKLGMGREFEGLELVPFEFLVMSNSSIRPTTPVTEAMIRETPIEGITLVGRATPPPQSGFFERLWNGVKDFFGGNKPEPVKTMDKVTESVKPENITKQVKPENAIDQILEGAQAGRETKGKTTQYEKEGGFQQTEKDFESLNPQNVKDIKQIMEREEREN